MRLALLITKPPPAGRIFDAIHYKLEEVEKWLLNCAKNANKPTPVASAITTKKVNAPKRLASTRLLNHVTSHQETRKIEVRYDLEQLSAPYDKRCEADDYPPEPRLSFPHNLSLDCHGA
jgi:hypothetical protein